MVEHKRHPSDAFMDAELDTGAYGSDRDQPELDSYTEMVERERNRSHEQALYGDDVVERGLSSFTARKEHLCSCCGRTIVKGERYTRSSRLDEATTTWYPYKECADCLTPHEEVKDG